MNSCLNSSLLTPNSSLLTDSPYGISSLAR